MTRYRLSFEMVNMTELWRYSNADPLQYKNTTQTVPNSQIPDEHWYLVSKETDDPWDQHGQLKAWADADEQFVRKVTLEQAGEPAWRTVTSPDAPDAEATP